MSDEQTFTPGPWQVTDLPAGALIAIRRVVDANDKTIAATSTVENARLIAEAPMMLDLLREYRTDHVIVNDGELCLCTYCLETRALIKRVKGENQ